MRIKRIGAILVSLCLLGGGICALPGTSTEVLAAEPEKTWFATKEELKSLGLGENREIVKVKFGRSKEWLVAGEDTQDGLALLDIPTSNISFGESNYGYVDGYSKSLIHTFVSTSFLRRPYYSTSEMNIMKDVKVTTDENGTDVSVTTKLYSPDAVKGKNGIETAQINVGSSKQILVPLQLLDSIYNFENGNNFWLRSLNDASPDSGLRVGAKAQVEPYDMGNRSKVVFACNLDMRSMLFASAAPYASSDGAFEVDTALTLRYADTTLGTAVVSPQKKSVTVSGIGTDTTYLVVQNNNGAWSQEVSGDTSVLAGDVHIGSSALTSFEGCRLWLETTDTTNRITTAALAVQDTADVTVTAGQHMTKTADSGDESQTGVVGSMKDVVYAADSGYYFPEAYNSDNSMDKNGITVMRNNYNEITVSGGPAANTEIILGDAKEKEAQDAPGVKGSVEQITGTTSQMEYAASETAAEADWKECQNGTTYVAPGTWYVRFKETKTKKAGTAAQVEAVSPSYVITAKPVKLTFNTVNVGYARPDALSVTITNAGNSEVILNQPSSVSGNYTIGTLSETRLSPKETTSFTVQPNADLKVGTYNEIIEVTTDKEARVSVDVTFTVAAKDAKNTEAKAATPRTGDNIPMSLWILILFLSAGGAIIIGVLKRQKKL